MSTYMTDPAHRVMPGGMPELKNSTSRKNNTAELDMTDFLQLMVVQLQNQSIDNTMDTSDMLNQMVQMQMITALANMTDASVMGYASSLVGKEVTIGDYSSGELVEKVVTITGSGVWDGEQVLFAGDEVYKLSSVMAVGRLPSKDGDSDGDEDDKVDGTGGTEGTGGTGGTGGTDGTDKTEGSNKTEGTDKAEGTNKTEGTQTDKTDAADKTGSGTLSGQISVDDAALQEKKMETVRSFLRSCDVDVPEDASGDELNELVEDYFALIEDMDPQSSTYQAALQAARSLLTAHNVNMAKDTTDAEILQAAENLLKTNLTETAGDAGKEQKPESETSVKEVSGQEQEAPAQDAE